MIKEWMEDVIRKEKKRVGVTNLIFCSDDYLLEVNKEFLKRDYLTDVISFDYTKEDIISGDVLISVDRVKENAAERGVSFLEELKRVMVHGVLHLIGYEDNTMEIKSIMTAREDLYLKGSPE